MTMMIVMQLQPDVEVYRRSSPSQPSLDDCEIDWEETVYLNLILQHVSSSTVLLVVNVLDSDCLHLFAAYVHSSVLLSILSLNVLYADRVVVSMGHL